MTQIMSNSWSAPIIDRNTDTRRVGPSSGSEMWRKACQRPAPSIRAASSSSCGMPWSPASRMIMWNPKYFHEMMTNRVSITIPPSPSQSWTTPPRPAPVERRVHDPGRPEHQAEDDAGDRLGQDIGQEEDQSEDRPAREAPVEQDGEGQRERDLDGQREQDDQHVVADRRPEGVVGQRDLVVLEPDEVGQRLQPVPLEQAVVRRLDDREQDEHDVQREGGQQEQDDRQPLRPQPGAGARPVGRRSRSSWSCPSFGYGTEIERAGVRRPAHCRHRGG